MYHTVEFDGHKIEFRSSGSGSLDPWTSEYARSLGVGIMCTSDMGEFMLIDDEHIYKFESCNQALELSTMLREGIIDNWEMFEKEWLEPFLKRREYNDFGTIEEHRESVRKMKERDTVWKAIPEKHRRTVYEYLKTIGKEATFRWYDDMLVAIQDGTFNDKLSLILEK